MSAIVIGALALGRHASAQAPDEGFSVPPDSELADDQFIILPDTDLIGLPPGDALILGPPVPAQVNFLFPHGAARPTLCPRRKLPVEDEGATIVANYYPPKGGTGTFTWSPTTEGGNVVGVGEHDTTPLRAYGWFWTRTVSADHGAHVRYDKNGTHDEDDGSPIRVFDAELTFDGLGADNPDYTAEETPGPYMTPGPVRKVLALQFWPEDLNSYLPPGMPHIPPPIGMTIAKSNVCVNLYSTPTGGDPITNTHWGWEIGQGGVPYWDPPPSQLYVEAAALGTSDVTLTLTYLQNWFPEPPVPTSVSATDKVKVNVIQVDLQVNETTAETDDYVVKEKPAGVRPTPKRFPAGAEDNHVPLRAVLGGPLGTTCHLKLSDGGGHMRITKDGGAALNPEGEPITVGTPLNLWLYGTTPSAALNDVVIEARTVETGDAVCGVEDLTVVWFDEDDLHFRGSDHQGEALTPGSTALFTNYSSWMRNQLGTQIYRKPDGFRWDFSFSQIEIMCQPSPNVFMGDTLTGVPDLTWDIKREASYCAWGPGVPPGLPRWGEKGAGDWEDDDPTQLDYIDEDLLQDADLTALFVIDGPGHGSEEGGLGYTTGYKASFKGKFREWIEVKTGQGTYARWFVCSPYLQWRAIQHLEFIDQGTGWGMDGDCTNEAVTGTLDGFSGSWTDNYGQ
jgi:hypothetical protein